MRIVSLLPSTTEIVYALGLGDSLVGITHECDYPPDARGKPILTRSRIVHEVGDAPTLAASIDAQVRASIHDGHSLYDIDAVRLAELRPDLILTQELCAICAVSSSLLRATLATLDVEPRVLSLEPTSLAAVYASIQTIGDATGTRERADAVVARLRERGERLRVRTAGLARKRTLLLEWTDPPMGSGHWTPALIELAGGTPMLGETGEYSRVITWDEIFRADPEVIIVAPCGMNLEQTRAALADLARMCAEWRELCADPRRRIVALDGHQFANRPGPRLLETAELCAIAIHPELAVEHVIPDGVLEAVG